MLKTKLYVATPCFGNQVFSNYMLDVMNLDHACQEWGVEFDFILIGNLPILPLARNTCVKHFLDSDSTHMLFLDADISFSPLNIKRLIDFDKDICCSAYPKKNIQWNKLMGKSFDTIPEMERATLDYAYNVKSGSKVENNFIEAKNAGTGVMLIKRTVFEQMAESYPELKFNANYKKDDVPANDKNLYGFFDTMIDPANQEYHVDDNAFCKRWTETGGKIYVDVGFPVTHIGQHHFGRSLHER
jgi:hypothetical protein